MPKELKLKYNVGNRIAWKEIYQDAKPGDFLILPKRLRQGAHGNANAWGKSVSLKVSECGLYCRVTVMDPLVLSRQAMLNDFGRLTTGQIKALHEAARKSGMMV